MKLREIEVGKTYYVRIPREVDEILYAHDSAQGVRWGWTQHKIHAEVLEVGVERKVIHRTSLGGIAGSPSVRSHETTTNDGVKIKFMHPDGRSERVAIVPPVSIRWEVEV